MFLRSINPFYAPENVAGASSGAMSKELSKEETIELLGEEDKEETLELPPTKKPEETPEEEDEEGKEKEEEVDELKEIEEELEGPKEEDLELMTPVRRRDILKKYPQLFKDFPYLEKAYYREQQFTELLPTINDAKVAVEKANILDAFDRQVMSGDITPVLQAAKEESQEAFHKLVDGYLPNLKQVDQGAYYHVMSNVIKDTIITMVREARAIGERGAPLQAAANILNQFVFGREQFEPPTNLARGQRPEEQNRENELRQQEQEIVTRHFESTREDLQTRTDNILKATIDGNIDPKSTMTDYVRKNATREAFETLESLIAKDAGFQKLKDRLWEKAFENRFDKQSTDKIKAAYLSKAKTLLPSVIKKARNDALRGLGKRVRDDDENEEVVTSSGRKAPIGSGRPATPSSGKIKKPSDIPRGMSTLDVLNMD